MGSNTRSVQPCTGILIGFCFDQAVGDWQLAPIMPTQNSLSSVRSDQLQILSKSIIKYYIIPFIGCAYLVTCLRMVKLTDLNNWNFQVLIFNHKAIIAMSVMIYNKQNLHLANLLLGESQNSNVNVNSLAEGCVGFRHHMKFLASEKNESITWYLPGNLLMMTALGYNNKMS